MDSDDSLNGKAKLLFFELILMKIEIKILNDFVYANGGQWSHQIDRSIDRKVIWPIELSAACALGSNSLASSLVTCLYYYCCSLFFLFHFAIFSVFYSLFYCRSNHHNFIIEKHSYFRCVVFCDLK